MIVAGLIAITVILTGVAIRVGVDRGITEDFRPVVTGYRPPRCVCGEPPNLENGTEYHFPCYATTHRSAS